MQSSIQHYAPSGAFRFSIAIYAVGGLLGAILFAGLYEFLLDLIPFVYVSFMLTLGFGFGLAFMASMIIKSAHCRNRAIAAVLALVIGGTGLAASFGWGYRRALSAAVEQYPDTTVLQLAQEVSVMEWMNVRMENGWTIRNSDLTGGFVVFVWIVEALVVLGMALMVGASEAGEPYCERCQLWTESQNAGIPGLSKADVQPLLDRGDLAAVLSLPEPTGGDAAVRIKLVRNHCPQCAETAYLTVSEIRTEVTNGKEKENSTELIAKAQLSPKLSALFLERMNSPQAEAALGASPAP
jgi:hypothetical protein